ESYAFMVDQDGIIINHPNKAYEISAAGGVNIEDTEYMDVFYKGDVFWMKDYDGRIVTCCTQKSSLSGFTVIVVQSWWSIYGILLIVGMIFFVLITGSIIAVVSLISRFALWQEETNAKLVEAADTAVAAEKAKSRFLAQMSHEIRTPINAVLGMNEMILRESDDPSIMDYAGNIRSAGKNLLELINTILDFSKIEEGKMEIIPVRYDTAAMIGNIINSVSQRAEDKGLVFEAHIDSDLPTAMYGDDMRVTQVVVNLLTNAVKYTREGRVDLYISGEKKEEETLALKMSVKDTGIGIKEEDIGRLFESFTRLEEKRNRNIEGTGLGMAIVNRLLHMMDSSLQVESVYGEGSTFSFTVKQKIVDAAPIGDYEKKIKEAIEKRDDDKYLYAPDARMLAVDDNDMNLKVITNLLKLNGIVPDKASSGADALKMLKENRYDIVLLDHMMPQMDGLETLQKAKEDDLIAEGCTVIALTANAVVGAREKYLEAGFDDYLSKPVEVAALERMLEKYLPEDKWTLRSRSEKKEAAKEEANEDKKQTVGGINMEEGLKYCAGDEEFYRSLLREYQDTYPERTQELVTAIDASDMGNYAVKVHALKSVSRTIGATELADAAFELEKAAKAGDIDTVKEKHPVMLEEYKRIITVIEGMNLPVNKSEDTDGDDDDDDIIEFFPE
ncbi:MAG: response regulator, partial [Lachnospiraceae bacterium]|nr:response regulator [Lachnospiraceae bacterium]